MLRNEPAEKGCKSVHQILYFQIPIMAASLPRTSARTAAGTDAPAKAMGRARVSMLRTWLVSTSPATANPSGSTALVPKGRTRDVIGHTTVKPVDRQKATGDTTSAGRQSPCSRPARGSMSVQIRSSASGS